MNSRSAGFRGHRTIVSVGLALALAATAAQVKSKPHACQPDSKLLGRVELSTVDSPGTWWNLTRTGMEAAGIVGDSAQRDTMQVWFGIGFNSLDDAVAYLVEQVRPVDVDGNGYVCAYSLRGTRTGWGDPDYFHYLFKVTDDR